MRTAVLTCAKLPGAVTADIPDAHALFADDRMLLAALEAQGVTAEAVAWSDPGVDWNSFDLALLRSTWDYIDDRDRFLAVLERVEASSCTLRNPLELVRWNTDKRYLLDLHEWGVPIVPTIAGDGDAAAVQREVTSRGWQEVVVKPMIGAGGAGVRMIPASDLAATLARLTIEEPDAGFLVQPRVESVRTEGECGYVFIGGEPTHVLLKTPAAGDYRTHEIYGGRLSLAEPSADDVRQARAIMAQLPFQPLYARLDLVRVDGRLAVMELELVEPMLYFPLAPHAAVQLAAASIATARGAAGAAGLPLSRTGPAGA